MRNILPVVEGEGDLDAVPELVRRILMLNERFDVKVLRPHRLGDLPKVKANFARYFETALLEDAPILWVMDFDCDFCHDVEHESASLRREAEKLRPGYPIEFCFVVKEYESLFLFDEATTRAALPAIRQDVAFPSTPEEIRGVKEWLSRAMPKGHAYKETVHHTKITSRLDLPLLRRLSPSYRRLETAVLRLADHAE